MWKLTKIYISFLINPALQVIEEWNIKAYKKTYIFIWVNNYYGGMLSNTYALDSFQRNVILYWEEVKWPVIGCTFLPTRFLLTSSVVLKFF